MIEFFKKLTLSEQFWKYSKYWLNFYNHLIVNIGMNMTQWRWILLKIQINTENKHFYTFWSIFLIFWILMSKIE